MKKFIFTLAVSIFAVGTLLADDVAAPVPHKVENLTLKSLTGEAITLPKFGEKNLLIFYIDPDAGIPFGNANMRFTDEIEKSGVTSGKNLFGFGILNTGDTALGEKMVCKAANKRTEKNNGTVLNDPDHIVSTRWQLGNCNGKCVIMIVSKEGELVYLLTEKVTPEDKAEFYKTIEKYR
ncbi:MAG: hypothetical protein IKC42_00190 [Alistipes sp.]|nr:hypothetical protein [Alistipes sp.]